MKLLTAITMSLLSSTAFSQTPPLPAVDAGPNAANKTPAPSPVDAGFVKQLGMGGLAEVDAGKVASAHASAKDVKEFGQQMVTDHSKANDKLAALAKSKNIDVPSKPDDEHIAKQQALEKLNGSAFDKKYLEGQLEDHQKTVQLLQHEINSGQDKDLRQFATDTLPVVTHHLEMVKHLQGATASSSAATR